MKVKHLELVRAVFFTGVALSCIEITANQGIIKEFNDFLTSNNLTQDQIGDYLRMGYNLSLLVGFNLEKFCTDYREIQTLYDHVVNNVAELMEYFDIQDNPIKVFAMFVYLYRSGYLSHNKEFYYSPDMKDMSSLCGTDVVRGTGVCRSIASMFTDVCQRLNYSAANISVNVKGNVLDKRESLTTVLLHDKDNGRKFARIVGKFTSIVPLGNHLVTLVDTNKGGIVLDPTNDVVMNMDSLRSYSFVNNTGAKMTYSFVSNFAPWILGQMDTELNVVGLHKKSQGEGLDYDYYCRIYRETQELIESCPEVFERFYEANSCFYDEIYEKMEKQHGLIKRVIPIIPSKRKK